MRSGEALLKALGEQLRANRLALELTQDELGRRASISGKYISEIERGSREGLPLDTLRSIVEQGLGLRLEIEMRPKNGSKPQLRIPQLPSAIEELARNIAALPSDERTRVVAIMRGILGLLS